MLDSISPQDSTDQLKVVAVVVTYNRPDELRQVVAALLGQSRPVEKIIVLDNAGPTPAADTLHPLPESLDVFRTSENLGGAGGFAKGLELAATSGADWLWLMDDDAVPAEDALSLLLSQPEASDLETGALCCSVEEYGQFAPLHRRRFKDLFGLEFAVPLRRYSERIVPIDMGSFVGFMVATRAVAAVGLPLAEMFIAYDDSEYSLRIRRAGFSIWLVPGSKVAHLRTPGSRLSTSEFGLKHYYNIRNRVFVKRCYAKMGGLAAVLGSIPGVVLWLRAPKKDFFGSVRELVRGLRDGFLFSCDPVRVEPSDRVKNG